MKRSACILSLAALLVSSAPVSAQTASEKWDVFVAPYLMAASMGGTTTVRGREAEVEVSASDIFDNLQFGAMGLLIARKGNWGFGSDIIWMALGTTVREINVDANQGAFAFYGLRGLGPAADLTFGLRINTLQGTLDFKRLGLVVDQTKTWVDPIVGLTLRTPPDRRVMVRVYTEIGGFGLGSDFTWQIFPNVGFRLTRAASIEVGYRWLDIDYASGEGNSAFGWDVLSQGPVVGFGFRF